MCRNRSVRHLYISECCTQHLCNTHSFHALRQNLSLPDHLLVTDFNQWSVIVSVILPLTFFLLVLLTIRAACKYYQWHVRHSGKHAPLCSGDMSQNLVHASEAVTDTLHCLCGAQSADSGTPPLSSQNCPRLKQVSTAETCLLSECWSGSGSGLPKLLQTTMARELRFAHLIGRGRFGEVWCADWRHEKVAIKIFYPLDEASWRRETSIYNTLMLRHDNILLYLGSDIISRDGCTQLLLATQYHELGSLHDLLSHAGTVLTLTTAVRVIYSALLGLCHLHTEIHGVQGKESIVHRDIKTKNMLVKDLSGNVVIADFGLALTRSSFAAEFCDDKKPFNAKVGTKRYMAPEILAGTMDTHSFEAFKHVDVYAFSLFMWEICNCTSLDSDDKITYQPPFYDVLPTDPSFEDVSKVVCAANIRPHIQQAWAQHPVLCDLATLMTECWCLEPRARLSTLRLYKSFTHIASNVL